MARLLTYDEILNGEGRGCLELMYSEIILDTPYCDGIAPRAWRGEDVDIRKGGYGEWWRYWDVEPTSEERDKTPWIGEKWFHISQRDVGELKKALALASDAVLAQTDEGAITIEDSLMYGRANYILNHIVDMLREGRPDVAKAAKETEPRRREPCWLCRYSKKYKDHWECVAGEDMKHCGKFSILAMCPICGKRGTSCPGYPGGICTNFEADKEIVERERERARRG